MTIREMVHAAQKEIRDTPDLLPDRAAELLMHLSALLGNIADEIREADHAYAVHLLACLETAEKANRAKIRAETSQEYDRKRQARDVKALTEELIASLKYYLRAKESEYRLARHQ